LAPQLGALNASSLPVFLILVFSFLKARVGDSTGGAGAAGFGVERDFRAGLEALPQRFEGITEPAGGVFVIKGLEPIGWHTGMMTPGEAVFVDEIFGIPDRSI
jgi:hypothetical protein